MVFVTPILACRGLHVGSSKEGHEVEAREEESTELRSQRASQIVAFFQKSSRRLELSISKNTPHGRWGQGPGNVGPRFPAGLPFPLPEILEFVAFRDSGKNF